MPKHLEKPRHGPGYNRCQVLKTATLWQGLAYKNVSEKYKLNVLHFCKGYSAFDTDKKT